MSQTHHLDDARDPSAGPSDRINPRELLSRETRFEGFVFDVVRERFRLAPGEEPLDRDFMRHPGAVAIAALNDRDEILLINQYRQPVGMNLWEIPAGMLDVEGEAPLDAARRELLEETDLVAGTWHTLAEFHNSPGVSTEANRVFLARDVSAAPEAERVERSGEEAEIVARWFPLEEAVAAVLGARIHSPSAIVAVLAARASVERGHAELTDPRAPWPAHPHLREGSGR